MSQQEINPLEDWASEELSEAELDALAGGRTSSLFSLGTEAFTADVTIIREADNMFSAFDGVKGSTLDATFSSATPLNLSMPFP